MSHCDAGVVVVGGGVAGATAALALARTGRDVLVLEQTRAPGHKVCGEFLSREAALYLEQVGLAPASLGALAIDRVRLLAGERAVEAPLPFPAWSLPRLALDEALLQAAAHAGARVLRGHRVERLAHAGTGAWSVTTTVTEGGGSAQYRAGAAFLASGKHDLRAWGRPPGSQKDLVAFKMYFHLTPTAAAKLGSAVELALFPGGYTGLQPVGAGQANLCLLIRRDRLRQLGGSWPRVLAHLRHSAPLFAERLQGALPAWERPLALSSIPYGFLLRGSKPQDPWRIGDQCAVIPSFAGEGLSLAMHSALLAARLYAGGHGVPSYTQCLGQQLRGQMQRATALSHGLVRWPGLAFTLARMCPRLLRELAMHTRIRDRHLLAPPA